MASTYVNTWTYFLNLYANIDGKNVRHDVILRDVENIMKHKNV